MTTLPDPPPGTLVDAEFTRRFMYPAPNTVYETMTNIKLGRWTIRVWREESEFKVGPDPEVDKAARAAYLADPKVVVDAICQLPRISAVEILDYRTGNGGLKYPDWK